MSQIELQKREADRQPVELIGPFAESSQAAALAAELKQALRDEVRFDAGSRALYATDASNYRQTPIGVVLARVQPGAILDHLQAQTEPHGLVFGPDPATHTHCTIGGMIGNNSCGIHSVMAEFYGPRARTSDNVESMEVLTYDGAVMEVGPTTAEELALLPEGTGFLLVEFGGDNKADADARARLLFEMLQGETLGDGWQDENVKEALDLCLSCKGCKGDCPVNVDVATYKAEFLSHYYEEHARPLPCWRWA